MTLSAGVLTSDGAGSVTVIASAANRADLCISIVNKAKSAVVTGKLLCKMTFPACVLSALGAFTAALIASAAYLAQLFICTAGTALEAMAFFIPCAVDTHMTGFAKFRII